MLISSIAFLLLSYLICSGVGINWKNARTFGRERDRILLYTGIAYTSAIFLIIEILALSAILGFDVHFELSVLSWEFALGLYLLIETFVLFDSYNSVWFRNLQTRWWGRPTQEDYFSNNVVNQLGWTFTDLPKFLEYPPQSTKEDVLELPDEETGAFPSIEQELWEMEEAERLKNTECVFLRFVLRSLFCVVFFGLLLSCTIARNTSRKNRSKIEEYVEQLPV